MPNLTNIATVGVIPVHGFHGRLASPQRILDDYARIGATGSGSQQVGTRGRMCSIEVWAGSNSELEAEKMADALEALQGTVVRVGDDFGRVFERVRIKTSEATIKAGRGTTLPNGAQMTHLIRATMTVEVLP